MLEKFKPDQVENTVYEIDLDELYEKGFRNIILDLDNTVTPWNKNEIKQELRSWICRAKEKGFKICLLSNNKNQKRIRYIAAELDVGVAPRGRRPKPSCDAFRSAMEVMGAKSEDTVVVGDQIFTDVWGGNRMNLYTILVDPISRKEFFGTKIARFFEKILFGRG